MNSIIDYKYPSDAPAEFVYQYHAYSVTNGVESHIDGIAQMCWQVADMEGYRKLKAMIAPDVGDRLIITSLNYLGRLSELNKVKARA